MTVTSQPADLTWDPFDFELHADPHPTWRRMREEAPLYRNEEFDFWAVTRFDDVQQVLVDWRTYSSEEGNILETIRSPKNEYADSLISEDPPLHDVHRHLLSRVFTPKAVVADRGTHPRLRPAPSRRAPGRPTASTSSRSTAPASPRS